MRFTNSGFSVYGLKMFDSDGNEVDLAKLMVTSVTFNVSAETGYMTAHMEMIIDQGIDFEVAAENISALLKRSGSDEGQVNWAKTYWALKDTDDETSAEIRAEILKRELR